MSGERVIGEQEIMQNVSNILLPNVKQNALISSLGVQSHIHIHMAWLSGEPEAYMIC